LQNGDNNKIGVTLRCALVQQQNGTYAKPRGHLHFGKTTKQIKYS